MTVLPLDEAVKVLKNDFKDTLAKIQDLKLYFNNRAVGCEHQKIHPAVSYVTDEWKSCNNEHYPFPLPRNRVCCLEYCPLGRIK